jgi:hypothetical protein
MKIRHGFVSNSSSSSFCILGIESNDDEFSLDIDEIFDEFEKTDLVHEYGIGDYNESQYMGMSPEQMKDDETLLQFKQRIVDEFKKMDANVNVDVTVNVVDLFWHTEGGYDG